MNKTVVTILKQTSDQMDVYWCDGHEGKVSRIAVLRPADTDQTLSLCVPCLLATAAGLVSDNEDEAIELLRTARPKPTGADPAELGYMVDIWENTPFELMEAVACVAALDLGEAAWIDADGQLVADVLTQTGLSMIQRGEEGYVVYDGHSSQYREAYTTRNPLVAVQVAARLMRPNEPGRDGGVAPILLRALTREVDTLTRTPTDMIDAVKALLMADPGQRILVDARGDLVADVDDISPANRPGLVSIECVRDMTLGGFAYHVHDGPRDWNPVAHSTIDALEAVQYAVKLAAPAAIGRAEQDVADLALGESLLIDALGQVTREYPDLDKDPGQTGYPVKINCGKGPTGDPEYRVYGDSSNLGRITTRTGSPAVAVLDARKESRRRWQAAHGELRA